MHHRIHPAERSVPGGMPLGEQKARRGRRRRAPQEAAQEEGRKLIYAHLRVRVHGLRRWVLLHLQLLPALEDFRLLIDLTVKGKQSLFQLTILNKQTY